MEHDLQLRATARSIYEACYLSEGSALLNFDEAERWRTTRYHQAVGAAQDARSVLSDETRQLLLFLEMARA